MTFNVYAINDAKSCFMQPLCEGSDAEAIRSLEAAAARPDSLLCTHAKDFSLYQIGVYDNRSGELEAVVPPRHVCDVSSLEVTHGL